MPRIKRQASAGIKGKPKQIRQYSHTYFLNEAGFAPKKKTRKTLTAMAKDHHGSDCMNLGWSAYLHTCNTEHEAPLAVKHTSPRGKPASGTAQS